MRDDTENDAAVKLENTNAQLGDRLKIEMRNGGGFVGRLAKQ